MPDRPNPFEEVERFLTEMNRNLGDVGVGPTLHDFAVDVAETDEAVVVTADLPGFETDDVTISLSGRDLSIEADREDQAAVEDATYVRRERSHRRLSRTVRLPAAVDESAASASYTAGVLTVTLPRETVEAADDSHTIDIG
jgi:HSP20 family protein